MKAGNKQNHNAGTFRKVPVVCVMTIMLAAVPLCGCGKISGGTNVFNGKEENTINDQNGQTNEPATEMISNRPEGETFEPDAAPAGGNGEESGEKEVPGAAKQVVPYAEMLEKKSETDIRAYFDVVSTDVDAMEESNFVILQWDGVINLDRYWQFEERYLAGEAADLILAQFGDDGKLCLDYLYWDGEQVVHYRTFPGEDNGNSDRQTTYETYRYLYTFVQRAEEKDRYKTLVLCDEENLTYEAFETLYYQEDRPFEISFIASFFYVEE